MEARAKQLRKEKKLTVYIIAANNDEKSTTTLQFKLSSLGFLVKNPFILDKMLLATNPEATLAEKSASKAYQLLRSDIAILNRNVLGYKECQVAALLATINGIPVFDENLKELPVLKTIGVHIRTR